MKYEVSTQKTHERKLFLCLEDYKTTFFYKQQFYEQHQADILFKIITIRYQEELKEK